jgi:hypothetical protein
LPQPLRALMLMSGTLLRRSWHNHCSQYTGEGQGSTGKKGSCNYASLFSATASAAAASLDSCPPPARGPLHFGAPTLMCRCSNSAVTLDAIMLRGVHTCAQPS